MGVDGRTILESMRLTACSEGESHVQSFSADIFYISGVAWKFVASTAVSSCCPHLLLLCIYDKLVYPLGSNSTT